MAQFNKVILMGHLTRDPELKQTNSGESVTTFSLAVNRTGKNGECDFFDITAWRKTAELVASYLKKGAPVLVCGKLQNRSYTDKQGTKRTVTEVVADEVAFIGSNERTEATPAKPNTNDLGSFIPAEYTNKASTMEEINPDELPF